MNSSDVRYLSVYGSVAVQILASTPITLEDESWTHQLDEVANETHDCEAHCDSLTNANIFCEINEASHIDHGQPERLGNTALSIEVVTAFTFLVRLDTAVHKLVRNKVSTIIVYTTQQQRSSHLGALFDESLRDVSDILD